ncbi:MAG: SDR family oxidoreductase [Burkholderiales bacterium]
MRVLVCGATGCVGAAVANALRARGHQVVAGARGVSDGPHSLRLDFMQVVEPPVWAQRLRAQRIEAVVNCVGILIPARDHSFERVHSLGPIELFRGAALAGVTRVLQVSALGVGSESQSLATPYLHSKLLADDALGALPFDGAVLRPSLVYGPGSQSARLFATLASLPVISLPGRGRQRVQPVHVFELAEAMVRLLEQPDAAKGTHEIAGPTPLGYREMLAAYRHAQGLGDAVWLPVPMVLMKLGALVAEVLPQKVFSRDTLRMLERGSVTVSNALPALLGRAPSTLAHGLAVTRPEPLIDLRVHISPPLAWGVRGALAFMWIYTALISALLPAQSGVLHLLARCGFEGRAGVAALVASCVLNLALGTLTLVRPSPWLYAVQSGAVIGYGLTAAFNMPELTLDHCAPLVKNVPVLMAVLLLWLSAPPRPASPTSTPRTRAAVRRSEPPKAAPAVP